MPRQPAATALPAFWSRQPDGAGGERLRFAVRRGATRAGLLALAALLIAGGLAAMGWLAWGGGLTVAGWIFLLLVPGGAVLAGIYILDRLLWAYSEYRLGEQAFVATRRALFGASRTEIPRSAIRAIHQQYTPPPASASRGHPGDWVTFVRWSAGGRERDFPLDGLHTPEEKQWLGPLLAGWARVELGRGFADSAVEADPQDLPED